MLAIIWFALGVAVIFGILTWLSHETFDAEVRRLEPEIAKIDRRLLTAIRGDNLYSLFLILTVLFAVVGLVLAAIRGIFA